MNVEVAIKIELSEINDSSSTFTEAFALDSQTCAHSDRLASAQTTGL